MEQAQLHTQAAAGPPTSTLSFLLQESVIFTTQCGFFLFAWLFFRAKLFKDYEVKHIWVQILFSLTFTLSCSMLELVICGILDVFSRE